MIIFAIKRYSIAVMDFITDPLAWIFIFIVYTLYKRNNALQRVMYGKKIKYSAWDTMASSIVFGLLAGLLGAIIITIGGISFYDPAGLVIIIVISVILMSINARYVCFSYSGGLWCLVVLIISAMIKSGFVNGNSTIGKYISGNAVRDISGVLAIIAIMHLLEAMLIWIDGHRGALPVFMKKDDRVIGAFILRRFWIVPMIFYILSKEAAVTGGVATPNWWPLIKPAMDVNLLKDAIFLASSIVIMMGYSDITTNMEVKRKTRISSLGLALFSVLLLILVMFSTKYYMFKYIAAIFAPIGHEILILVEQSQLKKKKPLWEYTDEGIIILDTIPGTPSEAMGMKSGEVLIGLNSLKIKTLEDAEEILKNYPNFLWVELKGLNGEKRTIEYKDYVNGVRNLGIITVPKYDYGIPLIVERDGFIKKYFKRK